MPAASAGEHSAQQQFFSDVLFGIFYEVNLRWWKV